MNTIKNKEISESRNKKMNKGIDRQSKGIDRQNKGIGRQNKGIGR